MRRRVRESVFWPGLTNQIEQNVRKCKIYLWYLPSKPNGTNVTTSPNQTMGKSDYRFNSSCEPGLYNYCLLLLNVDTSVAAVKKAQSANVLEACKDSFSLHGVPKQLVSDNGSQYSSHLFKKFVKSGNLDIAQVVLIFLIRMDWRK